MKSIRLTRCCLGLITFFAALNTLCAAAGDEHWSAEFGQPGTTNTTHAFGTHQGRLYFSEFASGTTNAWLTIAENGTFTRVARFSHQNGPIIYGIVSMGGDLYVGGRFSSVNDIPANGLARWDGTTWHDLGVTNGAIIALTRDGNDLYAGGSFSNPGSSTATNIAKWDGSSWHALGSGVGRFGPGQTAHIRAILVTNGAVYAAGLFTNVGTAFATNIASWNGTAWSALGVGLPGGLTRALAWFGSDLYGGGSFGSFYGSPANGIARWNGTNWFPLGSGVDGTVETLAVFQNRLYVGGVYETAGGNIAPALTSWTGTNWNYDTDGPYSWVYSLHSTPDRLYVGGDFLAVSTGLVGSPAAWDGNNWSTLGVTGKSSGLDNAVQSLATDGTNIYAGGDFLHAGTTPATRIARYDGANWHPYGPGLNARITDLAAIGPNVYAACEDLGSRFLGWRSNAWNSLDTPSHVLRPHFATRGSDLYIAGYFYNAFPNGEASWLARYDGTIFHPVLPFINTNGVSVSFVGAGFTAIADDGTNIFLGGGITLSINDTNVLNSYYSTNVFRFDGHSVWPLREGLNRGPTSIAVMGTNVFFAGPFTNASGVYARGIARWDGFNWFPVGGGLIGNGDINAFAVIGTNLYAGGTFTNLGNTTLHGLARWDGTAWTSLGSGLSVVNTTPIVHSLVARGNDLFVGGSFLYAGNKFSGFLARWNDALDFNAPVLRWHGAGRDPFGKFTATLTSDTVTNVAIERSTNFTSWTRVLTSSVTPLILVDSNAPAGPKHFYRALTVP